MAMFARETETTGGILSNPKQPKSPGTLREKFSSPLLPKHEHDQTPLDSLAPSRYPPR